MAPKCSTTVKKKKIKEVKKYRWLQSMQITFAQKNPKWNGCKAYHRYEKYMRSKTIQSAMDHGATLKDLGSDFARGFLTVHGQQPEVIQSQKQEEQIAIDDGERECLEQQNHKQMPVEDGAVETCRASSSLESMQPNEKVQAQGGSSESAAVPVKPSVSLGTQTELLQTDAAVGTETPARACVSVSTQTHSPMADELTALTHEIYFWRGKCERARLCTKPSNAMMQRHTRLCKA